MAINSPKTKQNAPVAADDSLLEALDGALRRLMWLERAWLKQTLSEYDLDVVTFMVLMQLQKQNGECPMGELSHALDLANATMTWHVDRLEQKGLVRREFGNLKDRRQVRVHITAQGKALARRVRQMRRDHLKQALGHLSARDRENFVRLLSSYLNELELVN